MKIIITERQEDLLKENIPAALRRRFNFKMIKDHLDFTVLESINPCDYNTVGDFIGEMCGMMVDDILEDYEYETGQSVGSKIKDDLYYFMTDNFADYLQELYDKQCA